ncbi:MAG TPA: hypothetical protein VLD67_21915, partial [Vicinamibacterales bacterium]|nr:hypothetical protein [Vicinamibacterales bacterium]
IPWNKGDAVRWIAGRVAAGAAADAPAPGSRVRTANREPRTANVDRVFTVYVGDDVTDEDAFRALRSGGLSIAASSRASGADLTLDGPPDVEAFLRALSRTLGPHQSETCGSGDQEDVNRRSGDQEDAERRPNGGRS